MRIVIMTDLEGVSGIVDFSQVYSTGKAYPQSRELLTAEVNAACEGALEAGADRILVVDGHGPGGINAWNVHPKALYGGRVNAFWGFDLEPWDAIFLLGHHAMAGVEDGNLNHTYMSTTITGMTLNGRPVGEIGMNIYLAGWFNLPVVLISGDRAACREGADYVPAIEQAIVKEGINQSCAVSHAPETARAIVREHAARALKRKAEIRPVRLDGPCEMTVTYVSSASAYGACASGSAERVDSRTIRVKGRDFLELWRNK